MGNRFIFLRLNSPLVQTGQEGPYHPHGAFLRGPAPPSREKDRHLSIPQEHVPQTIKNSLIPTGRCSLEVLNTIVYLRWLLGTSLRAASGFKPCDFFKKSWWSAKMLSQCSLHLVIALLGFRHNVPSLLALKNA